jgi:ribosomal protein S18 acetylase RimI-like enzyme
MKVRYNFMEIKKIEGIDFKKLICGDILKGLPNWFGIPEAIDEYIEESSKMPFFACYDKNTIVGFVAIKKHNIYSTEVYVMGISKTYHRQGVGRNLIEECIKWCKENDIEFLQVKTLDESHPDINYAKTRKFYEAMGFKALECFPTLWGEHNPCLLMIMKI